MPGLETLEDSMQAVKRVLDDAGIAWKVTFETHSDSGNFRADLEVILSEYGVRLLLEYHPALPVAQFGRIANRMASNLPPGTQGGLVVRRLSVTLLEACKAQGLCIFDMDGNAYLRLPGAVFIDRYRPAQNPHRRASAGTVFTAKASRIVRTLLSRYPHDFTQAFLVKETGLSRGYVSVLVGKLISDGYVSKTMDLLYLEQPDRLLDDWVAHYRFDRHQKLQYALLMNSYEQGLQRLADQLRANDMQYAFTGWSGAYLRAPYASPEILTAYVEKAPQFLEHIFPVERQGNVLLLVPQDEGVFRGTNASDYGPVASDAQLYVDLSKMSGRAKEQADYLRHEYLNFGERLRGR